LGDHILQKKAKNTNHGAKSPDDCEEDPGVHWLVSGATSFKVPNKKYEPRASNPPQKRDFKELLRRGESKGGMSCKEYRQQKKPHVKNLRRLLLGTPEQGGRKRAQ